MRNINNTSIVLKNVLIRFKATKSRVNMKKVSTKNNWGHCETRASFKLVRKRREVM